MIKEKIFFWLFLAIVISTLIFGFFSQGKKKEMAGELLRDIELATKKTKAEDKMAKEKLDFKGIKVADSLSEYKELSKRSPFFRVASELKPKKVEPMMLKEKPKKAMFKYKGKARMGSKVMVIIEDQGTGKSFFVKEGDAIGDFSVSSIDKKEVVLEKTGGEIIRLSTIKKEKKDSKATEE